MRISREKAQENREKVITAAAGLFRERGLEGVGIDAVAEAAGLTHGAVYSHFGSKNELAAEAVRTALNQSMAEWIGLTHGLPRAHAFDRLLKAYISRTHRDHPESGCSIAAIGGEADRSADELRVALAEGVARFIDILSAVSDGTTTAEKRRNAIAHGAAMVGAIVMARATSSDRSLSDEILKTVRADLIGG